MGRRNLEFTPSDFAGFVNTINITTFTNPCTAQPVMSEEQKLPEYVVAALTRDYAAARKLQNRLHEYRRQREEVLRKLGQTLSEKEFQAILEKHDVIKGENPEQAYLQDLQHFCELPESKTLTS
jgi:hypothetical protein